MKLQEEGFIVYVDKERMEADKLFSKQKCFSAVVKKDMRDLDSGFFQGAKDPECTDDMYETNYNKDIDKVMKQVAAKYTEDLGHVNFLLPSNISDSLYMINIAMSHRIEIQRKIFHMYIRIYLLCRYTI